MLTNTLRVFQERLLESLHIHELAAIGQTSGGVDRGAFFGRPPAADRVESLQRQTRRIHQVVARGALRVGAMLGEALANGQVAVDCVVLEGRHIGQRRRRRHAEQVVENPFAAQHRRRARGIGGHHENARLAQESASPAVFVERHAPEPASVYVRDPIVPGEAFIDERVVGPQQIERAAILVQNALDEQLGFLAQRLSKVVVEIGKQPHVRRD